MTQTMTLSGIFFLLLGTLAAASGPGSLVGEGARVNGVEVITGSTVDAGATVTTTAAGATIHLPGGELIEVSPNSTVRVGATAFETHLEKGSARVRDSRGAIAVLGAAQQRTRVDPNVGQGQVARLTAATSAGSTEIRVNSSARVLQTAPILIRSATTDVQAVYYIRSISGDRIRLTARLGRSFEPGDLVFQGDELDAAIAAGAVIVGGPAAASGGLSRGALVGILVGVGAGGGAAAALAGGGGGGGGSTSPPPPPGSLVTP